MSPYRTAECPDRIIDRCTANIYHDFIKSGGEGRIPTLPDWRNEVKRQPEREAQELALASELFVAGSLNMFAHETNFDIDNRIVCFDLYEMGEQLKPTALNEMCIRDRSSGTAWSKSRKQGTASLPARLRQLCPANCP